jgi:hypothetical protein
MPPLDQNSTATDNSFIATCMRSLPVRSRVIKVVQFVVSSRKRVYGMYGLHAAPRPRLGLIRDVHESPSDHIKGHLTPCKFLIFLQGSGSAICMAFMPASDLDLADSAQPT